MDTVQISLVIFRARASNCGLTDSVSRCSPYFIAKEPTSSRVRDNYVSGSFFLVNGTSVFLPVPLTIFDLTSRLLPSILLRYVRVHREPSGILRASVWWTGDVIGDEHRGSVRLWCVSRYEGILKATVLFFTTPRTRSGHALRFFCWQGCLGIDRGVRRLEIRSSRKSRGTSFRDRDAFLFYFFFCFFCAFNERRTFFFLLPILRDVFRSGSKRTVSLQWIFFTDSLSPDKLTVSDQFRQFFFFFLSARTLSYTRSANKLRGRQSVVCAILFPSCSSGSTLLFLDRLEIRCLVSTMWLVFRLSSLFLSSFVSFGYIFNGCVYFFTRKKKERKKKWPVLSVTYLRSVTPISLFFLKRKCVDAITIVIFSLLASIELFALSGTLYYIISAVFCFTLVPTRFVSMV